MDMREASARYLPEQDIERSAGNICPKGYKQTEVGVIPEDWNVPDLVEIAERVSVGLATSVTKYYRDKGVPIVRNLNIKDGYFDSEDMLYLDEKFAKANSTKAAKGLDVITVHTGANLGQTCVLPVEFDNCQTFTTLITTPIKKLVNSHYLSYLMGSSYGRREMARLEVGGGKGNLNTADLKKFRVPLPPTKAEQEAIAEALSDTDALIESLERLLTKKRQLKQGAMQDLLTSKKRLPGFRENWSEMTFSDIGRCYRGVSYNPAVHLSPFDTDSTVRLLRANNVHQDRIMLGDMQYVDTGQVSADQRLRANDILICMASGSREHVGKAGKFSINDGYEYTFGAFMGCFRPNHHLADPDFIFYLFQTEIYRAYIKIILAGSSISNLTPSNVEAFSISAPLDKNEQTAIATTLSDMDIEIIMLEGILAKARAIKQGMMQELLTGRIRLV